MTDVLRLRVSREKSHPVADENRTNIFGQRLEAEVIPGEITGKAKAAPVNYERKSRLQDYTSALSNTR